MASKELTQTAHQIPETYFRDVISPNPWKNCMFYKKNKCAQTIDDAVDLAKASSGVLPSAQEFAAYVLSGGNLNGHSSYWLRTVAYVSYVSGEIQLSLCDDAEVSNCVVSRFSKDLSAGHLRQYLAHPRNAYDLLQQERLRSTLEGRKLGHPGVDSINIDLNKESDTDILTSTEQWQSLFGILGRAFAKRVYRQRQQMHQSARITFYYPQSNILSRDRFTNPEGMRSVRISNFDCEEFAIHLDGSFREPAGVIAVRFPQDYCKPGFE